MLGYRKGLKFEERLDETGERRIVTVYGETLEFPSCYPAIWMLRDIEFYRKHRN